MPVTNRLAGQDYDILGNMTSHSATIEGQTQAPTLEYLDQGHINRILTGSGTTPATAWRYYYAYGERHIKAEGPAPGAGTPPQEPAATFHESGGWHSGSDAAGKPRHIAAGSGRVANSSFSFYAGENLICQLDTGTQVARSQSGIPDAAIHTSLFRNGDGNPGPATCAPKFLLTVHPGTTRAPKFLLTDHLGTTRAELAFDSSHSPVIAKIYDYLPYGEEISPAADVTEQLKFTGKQRDTESGLDFFGARYYGNTLFRWTSPDAPFEDNRLEEPQSWNLYGYVGNNPIVRQDPDGRFWNFVAGALIGGGIEIVTQVTTQVIQGKSIKDVDINWKHVGISAAAGAVTSGLSAIKGLHAGTKILIAAAGNVVESKAKAEVNGQKYSTSELVTDLTIGAVVEKAGQKGAKLAQTKKKADKLIDNAQRLQNIAESGRLRPAQLARASAATQAAVNYGQGTAAATAKEAGTNIKDIYNAETEKPPDKQEEKK